MKLPPRLARDVVARSVLVWAGLRLVLPFIGFPVYGPGMAAGMVALVSLLVVADARVTRERLLLANLGVPMGRVAAVAALPAAALEVASALGIRALLALSEAGTAGAASPLSWLLGALPGGPA